MDAVDPRFVKRSACCDESLRTAASISRNSLCSIGAATTLCLRKSSVRAGSAYGATAGVRKTLRFQSGCVARDLDSGCQPAEDALKREHAGESNDTNADTAHALGIPLTEVQL